MRRRKRQFSQTGAGNIDLIEDPMNTRSFRTLRTLCTVGFSILIVLGLLQTNSVAQRRQRNVQRYPVPVGAVHPDFRLPNVMDGKPVSLKDFQGRKVILVHFASW